MSETAFSHPEPDVPLTAKTPAPLCAHVHRPEPQSLIREAVIPSGRGHGLIQHF
jgi:hypothetical protein